MKKKGKATKKVKIDDSKTAEEQTSRIENNYQKQTIACIGEYLTRIILQNFDPNKKNDSLLLIHKINKNLLAHEQTFLKLDNILSLELKNDTHFWYQVIPQLKENTILMENLKNRSINNEKGVVILSSLWEGFASALNPVLISKFKTSNINSIALGILPSQIQPPDAHFNAYSSIGLSLSNNFTSMILLDRDQIENFVGINKNGILVKGTEVINYLLELITKKETFIKEIAELTRTFNIKAYGVLLASGASLSVYGCLENILNTTIIQPLLKFDVSTSSVLHVLVCIPAKLRKTLTKDKIEIALANWFNGKANLRSIQISEPIYLEGESDRIDIVLFMGGFNLSPILSAYKKKAKTITNSVIKQRLIEKKEWEKISKTIEAC
jgi:hypothetical protein